MPTQAPQTFWTAAYTHDEDDRTPVVLPRLYPTLAQLREQLVAEFADTFMGTEEETAEFAKEVAKHASNKKAQEADFELRFWSSVAGRSYTVRTVFAA